MFNKILEEDGRYIISNYGLYVAFVFQGKSDFIRRCENMVRNFGILKSGKFVQYSEDMWFCLAPVETIKNGMREAFRAEILSNQEVQWIVNERENEEEYEKTVDFDENLVESLVDQRIDAFYNSKLEYVNYLAGYSDGYTPEEYSIGSVKNQEEDIE